VRLAVTRAELTQVLRARFLRPYGFRLRTIGAGACTLDVPFRKRLERPGGLVNGQILMAAADVAMWLAIMTRLGRDDPSVTVELKTTFLRPVRRAGVRCRARILKFGRRLIYGVVESVTIEGELVAHHTVTYARPDVSP